MRLFKTAILATVFTATSTPAISQSAVDDLILYGEFNPPLTLIENDTIVGILPDILTETLKHAGARKSRSDITLVPWPRGYKAVQQRPNVLLFPMVRTPSREKLFNWVGPVVSSLTVVIAKKSKHINIEKVEDLKNYVVGAVQYDIGAVALEEAGLTPEEIFYVSAPNNGLQMLIHNRIDMWSYSRILAFWQLQSHGETLADYEIVYTLRKGERYFAISKRTDPKAVDQLQTALDAIRKDGLLQKAVDRYLPGGNLVTKR